MSLRLLSESVYVGLCRQIIGTFELVKMRRDIHNFIEVIVNNNEILSTILSGSFREGFRFESSDIDRMIWLKTWKVVWNLFQFPLYIRHVQQGRISLLIVSDSLESPPGFTMLWLPMGIWLHPWLESLCVGLRGAHYISSSKFREWVFTALDYGPGSIIHGPCTSKKKGNLDHDFAFCYASDFWPPSAFQWIERCQSWPPQNVVHDIVKSGCHFVPIGHKLGNHVDNEWRISFSLAEQKLVYSMNHTQFLTYGLLKLFVTEIINHEINEEDKLLCSYHMKTAVFWSIQQNTKLEWCPQNLLACFWVCFKLLLKWVYEGVCPNFFIPENNLFLSNIFGEAQKNLFTRLYGLYEKGIIFLIQSPSIRPFMRLLHDYCNISTTICIDKCTMIPNIDAGMFFEIHCSVQSFSDNPYFIIRCLHTVQQLIWSPLTQIQVNVLQIFTVTKLRAYAFMVNDMYTSNKIPGTNKSVYTTDKLACYMLKLAAKFGSISDTIFVAMYYYKTYRFSEALSAIEITKVRMEQPYVVNVDLPESIRWYEEALRGRSFSYKMRHAFIEPIRLFDKILYINELIPEQQSSDQSKAQSLVIPHVVLLHMLEFLCCRHLDPLRAQTALRDLQVLVHHDQEMFIPKIIRDISWQILGICQQIAGDFHAALFSFEQSLRELPLNCIQTASRQRIQDLHLS